MLLIQLLTYSCQQGKSVNEQTVEGGIQQGLVLKPGLKIENGINRGTGYTNSQGVGFNLRYIPITITNDTTIKLQLKLDFGEAYDCPMAKGDEYFKILLMPEVFTLDNVTLTGEREMLTDSMQTVFRGYVENDLNLPYALNKTLAPGEKHIIAIGTQYPRLPHCAILPNALFLQSSLGQYQTCDNRIEPNEISNAQLLGLKLDYSPQACSIIPCGQITYLAD